MLGVGFGARNSSSYTIAIRLGDSSCEATDWIASTSVNCLSASGTSATRRVLVTSGQRSATITGAYSYERPILSDFLPTNAAATGRMTVTCLGSNFGMVDFTELNARDARMFAFSDPPGGSTLQPIDCGARPSLLIKSLPACILFEIDVIAN